MYCDPQQILYVIGKMPSRDWPHAQTCLKDFFYTYARHEWYMNGPFSFVIHRPVSYVV